MPTGIVARALWLIACVLPDSSNLSGYCHVPQIGVVALCLFELRRLGRVGNLVLVGTTGTKFTAIRDHLARNIRDVYNGMLSSGLGSSIFPLCVSTPLT